MPVDFVVGQGRIAARVEDEVLLEEDDEPVLDLPSVEVGSAGDGCKTLPSMARKNREYPLRVVRSKLTDAPVASLEQNLSAREPGCAGGGV